MALFLTRFTPLPHTLKRRIAAVVTLAALSACSGGTPDPSHDPVGVWEGALVTDQGQCPTDRNSILTIGAHEILFSPGGGSVELQGVRGPDNLNFHAKYVGKDASGHAMRMVFNGYPVGQAIGGTYGTPSCRAHITMTHPRR